MMSLVIFDDKPDEYYILGQLVKTEYEGSMRIVSNENSRIVYWDKVEGNVPEKPKDTIDIIWMDNTHFQIENEEKELAYQVINQNEICIKEKLEFDIRRNNKCQWDESMPAVDTYGNPFSKRYPVNVYTCKVDIMRYATINGKVLPDSYTHKYITYIAYEDSDLNSIAQATVDTGSRKCIYSDSSQYFNDIDEQMINANSNKFLCS